METNTAPSKLSDLDAILIIEDGSYNEDDAVYIQAWQQLADSGVWRQLQGFYQRGMRDMVDAGLVTLPGCK